MNCDSFDTAGFEELDKDEDDYPSSFQAADEGEECITICNKNDISFTDITGNPSEDTVGLTNGSESLGRNCHYPLSKSYPQSHDELQSYQPKEA